MIEFCKALDEVGIKPTIISGTSIGAIIGSFYAAGFSGLEMEHRLSDLSLLKIPRLVDFKLFSTSALLKGRRIAAFLRSTIGCETFEELSIPLKISAADFWQRRELVFDSGPLIPAIRASISLPVIFEPVPYENTLLIDGGICNPLPCDLIRDECDYLIAIDVSGTVRPRAHHHPRMFDSIMNSFEAMQSSIILEKLRRCQVDCYIKPTLENIGILDFYHEKEIRQNVQHDVIEFKRKLEKQVLSLA